MWQNAGCATFWAIFCTNISGHPELDTRKSLTTSFSRKTERTSNLETWRKKIGCQSFPIIWIVKDSAFARAKLPSYPVFRARFARFFLVQQTKMRKKYTKRDTKIPNCYKLHQNDTKIPNGHEIHKKYIPKPPKISQNLHFWYKKYTIWQPCYERNAFFSWLKKHGALVTAYAQKPKIRVRVV
jgi:hypothetical protein